MGKGARSRRNRAGEASRRNAQRARDLAMTALLLDTRTAPDIVAAAIVDGNAERLLEYPVEAIWHDTSHDHALAVAEAALALAPDSYRAVMFAEGIFGLHGDDARCVGLLRRAMTLAPSDPIPRYVLAGLLTDLGRPDEALEIVEPICLATPADHSAQRERAQAIAAISRRLIDTPDDVVCDCGSGKPYEDCHFASDDARVSAWRDRSAHEAMLAAIEDRWNAPELYAVRTLASETFDDPGLATAIEVAAVLTGYRADDPDATVAGDLMLDPTTPRVLAENLHVWEHHRRWGMWQIASRLDDKPFLVLRDIITGLIVDVPDDGSIPDGARRWSVLLGSVAPTRGIWRPGRVIVIGAGDAERVAAAFPAHFNALITEISGFEEPLLAYDPASPAIVESLMSDLEPDAPHIFSGVLRDLMPAVLRDASRVRSEARSPDVLPTLDQDEIRAWIERPHAGLDGATPRDAAKDRSARLEGILRVMHNADERPGAAGAYELLRAELHLFG